MGSWIGCAFIFLVPYVQKATHGQLLLSLDHTLRRLPMFLLLLCGTPSRASRRLFWDESHKSEMWDQNKNTLNLCRTRKRRRATKRKVCEQVVEEVEGKNEPRRVCAITSRLQGRRERRESMVGVKNSWKKLNVKGICYGNGNGNMNSNVESIKV